jgi:hypothetical protein
LDDVIATAGSVVQVPLRLHISGGLPARVVGLNILVEPLDGSPDLVASIDISPSGNIGTPTIRTPNGLSGLSVAWLDASVAGISGDATLATLSIPIPATAGPSSAYRVRVKHFSASPNGLGLLRANAYDGVITLSDRSASSWNDSVSDLWRLRWFGSATDLRSSAGTDADLDGRSNLDEFRAGTNPMNLRSRLALDSIRTAAGIQLRFPTGLGRTYIIECAPQLGSPWVPIFTNAGDGGLREFTDPAAGGGHRFYRVRAQ